MNRLPSTFYDEQLEGWHRVEREAMADGARPRTEVLWINPKCAAALDARARGGPLFDIPEASA